MDEVVDARYIEWAEKEIDHLYVELKKSKAKFAALKKASDQNCIRLRAERDRYREAIDWFLEVRQLYNTKTAQYYYKYDAFVELLEIYRRAEQALRDKEKGESDDENV